MEEPPLQLPERSINMLSRMIKRDSENPSLKILVKSIITHSTNCLKLKSKKNPIGKESILLSVIVCNCTE